MPIVTIDPAANIASARSMNAQSALHLAPDYERQPTTIKLANGKSRTVPGRLTRKGMEAVVASGQSVHSEMRALTRHQDLPTEDDLAITSGVKEDVDARVKAKTDEVVKLQAELAALKAAQTPAATVSPVNASSQPSLTEPTFGDAKHPLSYFKDRSDEDIATTPGVGPATMAKIKAALATPPK